MDIDKLNSVPPDAVRQAGVSISNALQSFEPGAQVASAAAFFVLLCECQGIHPGTAMQVAANVMTGDDGTRNRQFEALKDYINGEGLAG